MQMSTGIMQCYLHQPHFHVRIQNKVKTNQLKEISAGKKKSTSKTFQHPKFVLEFNTKILLS